MAENDVTTEKLLTSEQTSQFVKETSTGSSFDASAYKNLAFNPEIIKKQKNLFAMKYGMDFSDKELMALKTYVTDKIISPLSNRDNQSAMQAVRDLLGDWFMSKEKNADGTVKNFVPINARNRNKKQYKEILEARAKLNRDPNNVELKAKLDEFESAIVHKTIPFVQASNPIWDMVLDTTDIDITVLQRGEPLRYQYPFPIKMAFFANPNGTLEEVQYVPSRTTVSPNFAVTEKKQLRFEDWLNDEAGTFLDLKARLPEDMNRHVDLQLELARQAVIPDGSLYSSHAHTASAGADDAGHILKDDIDGTKAKKFTPTCAIKMQQFLQGIYTTQTLITEANLRANLPTHTCPASGFFYTPLRALIDIQTAGTAYFSRVHADELIMNGINGRFGGIDGTPMVKIDNWDDDVVRLYPPKGYVGAFINITTGGNSSGTNIEMVNEQGTPFSRMDVWGWKYYAILIGGYYHLVEFRVQRGT